MIDQEVFSAMDAVIRPQEGRAVPVDMEVEGIINAANCLQELPVAAETEMLDVTDAPGLFVTPLSAIKAFHFAKQSY